MEALHPYRYQTLDLSGPWIRLLTVQPRTSLGSEIRCEIRHVRLPEATTSPDLRYTALSYTWGQPNSPRHPIIIANARFEVHENLYDFLNSLRSDGIQDLWVDAICIDQSNSFERNHQVSEMRNIYEMASRVIIWLGKASADKTWLFNHLNSITNARTHENLPQTRKMCQTTADICNKQYWRRTWVIQEVLLAKKIELACGTKRLPWEIWLDHVFKSATTFSIVENDEEALNRRVRRRIAASRMYTLARSWSRWRESPQPIGYLVLQHLHSECLRSHDKVYGLLGLATDAEKIPVNYDTTIEDVVIRVLDTMWEVITKDEFGNFCKGFDISPARLVQSCDLNPSALSSLSIIRTGNFAAEVWLNELKMSWGDLDLDSYPISECDENNLSLPVSKPPCKVPMEFWYPSCLKSCGRRNKAKGTPNRRDWDICPRCIQRLKKQPGAAKALMSDNSGTMVPTVCLSLFGFDMLVFFDSDSRYLATGTTSKTWYGKSVTLFFDPVEIPLNRSGRTYVTTLSSRHILNLLAHQDLYHNPEKNIQKTNDDIAWRTIFPMSLLWNRSRGLWDGAGLPWYGQIRYQPDKGWSFCLPET